MMEGWNLRKRIFSLILAVGMVCALAVPASASELTTNGYGDEYLNHLKYCMENGLESIVPDWYKEEYYAQNQEPDTKPEIPDPKPQMPAFKHYSDVPNDAWYAEAINAMTDGGLLKGYDDGLFHPDDIITAGQFATILCRIGGEDPGNENFQPYSHGGETFSEPRNWAHWAIVRTTDILLYPTDYSRANWSVVRGEAICYLVSLAVCIPGYHENNDPANWKQVSEKVWTIDDIPDVDKNLSVDDSTPDSAQRGWCAGGMSAGGILRGYNLGIAHGVDNLGTCKPYEPMTRAELCQMLYNMGIVRESCVSMWGHTAYHYEGEINPGPRQTTAD